MKKIFLFLNVLFILFVMGCKQKEVKSELDVTNLDQNIDPKSDFYQFACGGWMKNNPLPGEYARYSNFDKLDEVNQKLVHDLVEQIASSNNEAGSNAQKIGSFFKMGMDSVKLNTDGYKPIEEDIEMINAISTKPELMKVVAQMHLQGLAPFFMPVVHADMQNSTKNIINLYQAGLGLSDKDYYTLQDDQSKQLREKYIKHIANMFKLTGSDEAKAKIEAEKVMAIENRLAAASYDKLELRDPYFNYKIVKIKDLQKEAPAMNWPEYFKNVGIEKLDSLNNSQPRFIVEANNVINTMPLEDLKIYLKWNLIHGASSYLSDDLIAENFDFYGKTLSGQEQMRPRWKRVVNTMDNVVGEAIGQEYASKYFPPEAKQKMLTLVKNLQEALGERIKNATWMSEETKEKALEKLAAFRVKIGYPDKWRDYSGLEITDNSYWNNLKHASEFDFKYMLSKLDKPVDFDEWQMTPQTVNAYYSPITNEICFPAAILQPPFFYLNGDDALNYGAIGVVIGHEMTHGFDDQGRQFDKNGNLNDWWTAQDAESFTGRSKVLVDYFDNITVIDTLHANGKFTLGENIADNGGLNISFLALQKALEGKQVGKIDNFTQDQRFFLSYANVWAGNIRDKEIVRRTKEDPHSLGKWRVNGTLPHIEAFIKAFDVKETDAMYLAPENRASIW